MFKELTGVAQREDEPRRRWFSSDDTDLSIWLDPADEPIGFQFSFRESDQEFALTWRPDIGIRYDRVDGGEASPKTNRTPILLNDGRPHWPSLARRFQEAAAGLDAPLRGFVTSSIDRLRYQGHGWAGRESDLAGYCRWVESLNLHAPHRFSDLMIHGQRYGSVTHAVRASLLSGCGEWLEPDKQGIALRPGFDTFESRSEALHGIARHLESEGHSRTLMNEPYPVTLHGRQQSIAKVDRTVVGQLGLLNFSQHLNGYVRRADGIHLWIGQRALDKPTWPGKLDQMVAGGLPSTISLADNLVKECHEEAGVPEALARQAVPIGTISYHYDLHNGQRRDIIFCYDLALPEDFIPEGTDGEVDSFRCLPLEEVARLVRDSDDFKANCNLVNIDFLLRHGAIDPEQSGYRELCEGLRGHLS